MVACILVGVGAYAKAASVVSSLTISGGIIAAGVFLFVVAVLGKNSLKYCFSFFVTNTSLFFISGLIGASRHHQVSLFFVSIFMLFVFVICVYGY